MHSFDLFCKHIDSSFNEDCLGGGMTQDSKDYRINWATCKVAIFRNIAGFVYFHNVRDFSYVKGDELVGLSSQISILDSNTRAFLDGRSASNALLWGSRGCGKSSVIKAVLSKYLFDSKNFKNLWNLEDKTKSKILKNAPHTQPTSTFNTHTLISNPTKELPPSEILRVIEVDTKDFSFLPLLFDYLREIPSYKFIIFSDDLGFENGSYRSLKSTLQGSFEAPPCNVLLYATSNLRHLVHEEQQNNTLHEQDNVNESMAFSDRFPLSIGFYPLSQREFLEVLLHIIKKYVQDSDENQNGNQAIEIFESIKQKAINFATKIGNKSPRSAKDFFSLYLNGSV